MVTRDFGGCPHCGRDCCNTFECRGVNPCGWVPPQEKAETIITRTTQLRIYRDVLTRRIVFEVVEYDLILKKNIRSAREVVGQLAEDCLANAEYFRDPEFPRYFVAKTELRLLFQLGLQELPL